MSSHFFIGLAAIAMLASEPTFQPVREVAEPVDGDRIEFVAFEFQRPGVFEFSVHYTQIEEDPSVGVEYGVRASLGGEEAIATSRFDAVDENGTELLHVPIVPQSIGVGVVDEFLGLMTVPARPFLDCVDRRDRRWSKIPAGLPAPLQAG
jgi:hypothetical protein